VWPADSGSGFTVVIAGSVFLILLQTATPGILPTLVQIAWNEPNACTTHGFRGVFQALINTLRPLSGA
jgi:hypothetical protein